MAESATRWDGKALLPRPSLPSPAARPSPAGGPQSMGISREASSNIDPDGFPGTHMCLAQLLPLKTGRHVWLSIEGTHFIGLAGLKQPARAVHGEGVANINSTSSTTLFVMTSPRQICRLEYTGSRRQLSSKEASCRGCGGPPWNLFSGMRGALKIGPYSCQRTKGRPL